MFRADIRLPLRPQTTPNSIIEMKNLTLVLGSFALLFASCSKQPVQNPGTGNNTQHEVNIEYRITNISGNVSIEYIAPLQGAGVLGTCTAVINKTYETISFTAKNGQVYSIEARNTNPSTQDITVDIYVDGQLFKSGSLNHTTMTASASGRVE